MKRVLVTGARGFIGNPCVESLLKRNFEIHAISSKPIPKSESTVNWYQVGLHDHAGIKKLLADIRPDVLVHLAWYVEHGAYWSSLENLKWVSSSLNLVEEFISNGGQRIIGMGTCAEYDWSEEACSKNLSEDSSTIKPSTLYGASKAGLCMVVNALCQLKGVSFAWGRLFFPYGPYEQPQRLIPNTISSFLQGKPSICKQPDLRRDFIYVQDIAEIVARLVDSDLAGPINIASGKAVKLGDVVKAIAKILGVDDLVQYGTSSISMKNDDPSIIVGDITRLRDELGFTEPVALEQGLEKTIAWWREQSLIR